MTERVSELERELQQAQMEIVTLGRENSRLAAERDFLSVRLGEIEVHNRLLTDCLTETTLRVQGLERDLLQARVEGATLGPDNVRLAAERDYFSVRLGEIETHNRQLTEALTESARSAQQLERELNQARIEIATLGPDNIRLGKERDFLADRLREVDAHNRLLTEAVTDYARRLKERAQLIEAASSLPSILFVSIPKSGTVFTGEMLVRGLGLELVSLTKGVFPRYLFDFELLHQFRQGGRVAIEHADASAENLQLLAAFVDRWIVHVRDPRSVLVSWVHHLNRLHHERDSDPPHQLLLVCPTPPEEFFGDSFSDQVDWNIEHFLPSTVEWINAWTETQESGRYNILMTNYSDIVASEGEFLFKILDFYAIPHDLFRRPTLEKTMTGLHFRVGREDEWRDCLSPQQIARATDRIGEKLLARFGWPRR